MEENNKTNQIECKLCGNHFEVNIETLEVGDIIECPICGGTQEVTNTSPLQLEVVIRGK